MTNWLYKGEPLDESIMKGYAGFVYMITDLETSRRYLGRKYITFRRKKGKKRVSFESDWRDYYGSSKELAKMVEEKGKDNFRREIIAFGKTKGEVNFMEVMALFHVAALESEDWINESINKWRKVNVSKYSNLNEIRDYFKKP